MIEVTVPRPKIEKVTNPEPEYDMVSRPRHYNREGAIECIDEMVLVFGEEATANFCLLNCWKYRYRSGMKDNGFADIEKSDWYMRKYKELKEKLESTKVTTIGDYIPSSPYNPWNIQPNWVGTLPTMTCAGVSNVQRD